jgi:hypothetical protein
LIFHESRDNGFVALRRNLIPHIEDGRLGMNEAMVLIMLILLADSSSGELVTCASALRKIFHCGKELNDRAMQRILDRLETGGYIHRSITQGKRGLYKIRLNNYEISTGTNKGKRSKILPRKQSKSDADQGLRTHLGTPEDGTEGSVTTHRPSNLESIGSGDQNDVPQTDQGLRTHPDATKDGSEDAAIQHRDLTQTREKETETESSVVGGGGSHSTEEGELDPLQLSVDPEPHHGTDLSDEPGEEGNGKTEPTYLGGEHHGPDQGKLDRALDDRVADGESITLINTCPPKPQVENQRPNERSPAAPAAPAQSADPLDAPFERDEISNPVAPLSKDAPELVRLYFGLLGGPSEFVGQGLAWVKIANRMLASHTLADILAAAEYALRSDFWAPFMLQLDRNPFLYFESKLPKLLAQLNARKNAATLKSTKPNPKSEAHHGRKDTPKSKRQIIAEENRANLDELRRETREHQN